MEIAVVGVGGAGGNIAHEAYKLGIPSAAINGSTGDLGAVEVKYYHRLTGSDGVGKNRDDAISLIQEQWESVVDFIQGRFANADVIIFAFSSSGGTGSGATPILIDIVSSVMSDKVISAFVVMPDLSEATVSQTNCLKTFDELSKLNVSIFPIDNQQAKVNFRGKNKIFEYTNKEAIGLLKTIANYTEKYSRNGIFDKRDFLTVLGTPGIALMSEIDLVTIGQNIQLSEDWISDKVKKSFVKSVFVPVEFEKVTRAAVIFDGQESLMDFINYESMFDCFLSGMPMDMFEGNYHEDNGKLFCILTGLGWCNKRLQDIDSTIERNKDKIEAVLTSATTYQSNAGDYLNKLRKQPEKKKSVTDILNKYRR